MVICFPVDRFDEVVELDQWVIGRHLDSNVRGRLARRQQEKYVRWRQPRVTSAGAPTLRSEIRICTVSRSAEVAGLTHLASRYLPFHWKWHTALRWGDDDGEFHLIDPHSVLGREKTEQSVSTSTFTLCSRGLYRWKSPVIEVNNLLVVNHCSSIVAHSPK
jgi:hypothetical protein